MKKTVYALFLIVLLFSNGCSKVESENVSDILCECNAFRISKSVDGNGKISMCYTFPINSKFFVDNGFENKDLEVYKFYLLTYVNTLQKQVQKNSVDGMAVSGVLSFDEIDSYGFAFTFENATVQSEFFGKKQTSENENKGNNIEKSGFFVEKIAISTNFPISTIENAQNFMSICKYSVVATSQANSLSQEQVDLLNSAIDKAVFVYDYSTSETGLCSDMMYQRNGLYHNVFVKSLSDIESDPKICFWTCAVNKGVWYICATIFVLFLMIGLVLWLKMSEKKKKLKKIK